MHLDRIEITNFKSYRGSHLIGPFDRLTCIIGPNGSGKSNILDAISFVLNVPNSCLRVRQLKNLISYGETEGSVKIVVSGRTFERRVSKNTDEAAKEAQFCDDSAINESLIGFASSTTCRYFADGSRVSQKQYNHELELLNILNKAKNFVIYQGDIIKSDIDLLKIVETTCGSDLYIDEYNALAGRLNAQNKDLSLKYEKRRDCLELLKEMDGVKEKERNFKSLVDEKESIQKKIYELQMKCKKDEIQRLKSALSSLESMKNEDLYNEHLDGVNRIRSEAAKLQKEYFEKESELSYLKSKNVQRGDRNQDEKLEELKSLEARLKTLYEDLSRFRPSLNINRGEFETQLAVKEREYSLRVAHLEKQLSEATLLNFDKLTKRDLVQTTLRQMNTKTAKIRALNAEIERENKAKQEKVAALNREIEVLRNRIQDRISSYEKIVSDEEKLGKELNAVMKEILLNKAKKNDLTRRSLIKGVVNNLKNIFSGVHGRVIDLVEPTQKKYEMAVGVLLSRYDQAVIVDNEKVAMDCLRYIKETKSCKLTFLPLSRIKIKGHGSEPVSDHENQSNIVKADFSSAFPWKEHLSRRCIAFSQTYEKAVNFIFGNSLIVDSAATAKHILYANSYPGKICTLDGTLFSPNGLITGGRESTNKFEDNLVEALLNKRKIILDDLKINRDRKEAFSDVGTVKERIDELAAKRDGIRLGHPETAILDEMNFSSLQNELEDLEHSLREFECQQKGIREAKKQFEKGIISPLLSTIGVSSLSEYKERLREDIRKQEIAIDIEAVKDKIALIREELVISSKPESKGISAEEILAMDNELNRLYSLLENVKDRLKGQSSMLRSISERRSELNATILNHQLHLSRVEEELKDVVKYAVLESGFREEPDIENLTLSKKATESVIDSTSVDSLRAQLEIVNQRINENVPTVSSADSSIQTKYSKFNREYEIAKEAVMTTKTKFVEVKRLRTDAFAQCFARISAEIPQIYQSLTKTDSSADSSAYLVYEGDPFANNLKYYLIPPSKRFTEFHELSGGEKSIALLSFIFALSRFRKPPFYIFDEIDSALDRLNVERLSNYMLESSDQFLVVSLKHQLFQKSESLVGVYKCPRENRSKVLSYRLK